MSTVLPLYRRDVPERRADCVNGPRPCMAIRCRFNMLPDGARPTASCCLDQADRGEHTLQDVADALQLTRERIRQIEERAIRRLVLHIRGDRAARETLMVVGERRRRNPHERVRREEPEPDAEPEETSDGRFLRRVWRSYLESAPESGTRLVGDVKEASEG